MRFDTIRKNDIESAIQIKQKEATMRIYIEVRKERKPPVVGKYSFSGKMVPPRGRQ